jgi:hypothetical protein
VVDPSLLRQAADRGVTIAFADLDGADGLWVPEERTVLVSRGLPEDRVAEVIEHELTHVRIDDQHADLDAGKDVLIGRPAPSRRPAAAALAAASLVVLIGGVTYGVHAATGDTRRDQVAPNPDGPGLTADESGPAPSTTVIPSIGPDGRVHYRTVTVTETAPVPSLSGSPTASPSAIPSGTRAAPQQTARPTAAPPARGTTSPAPPPVDTTTNPPVTTTEPETTTPEAPPTTPAEESGAAGGDDGAGVGDGGLGDQGVGGDTGTGLGTGTDAAGTPAVVDASAVTAVGSTTP